MNLFLMITWCVLLVASYLLSVKVLEKSGKM